MELKIEYVPKESLTPYFHNAKLHPAEQVEQIKKSIQEFGFNDPIAIWGESEVVEGHGRLLAVMEMPEIETVPIIRLDHLNDEQKRAYALVHNKLTMNSDFDMDLLFEELEAIDLDMNDFGFDFKPFEQVDEEADYTGESSFNYTEQYGVIVMCSDEQEQEKIYNRLTEEGFTCKVVAV